MQHTQQTVCILVAVVAAVACPQVLPFHVYREQAVLEAGRDKVLPEEYQRAHESRAELERVEKTLVHLRNAIILHLKDVSRPKGLLPGVLCCGSRAVFWAARQHQQALTRNFHALL